MPLKVRLSAVWRPMPVVVEMLIQHGIQNLGRANVRGRHGELNGDDGDMTLKAAKGRRMYKYCDVYCRVNEPRDGEKFGDGWLKHG